MESILTARAHRDLDLNPVSHGCKPSTFTTELSHYLHIFLYICEKTSINIAKERYINIPTLIRQE